MVPLHHFSAYFRCIRHVVKRLFHCIIQGEIDRTNNFSEMQVARILDGSL